MVTGLVVEDQPTKFPCRDSDMYHCVSTIFLLFKPAWFQVDDAETVFNHFRRAGHQFDVEVYNKMIFGWAQKVQYM